VRYLSVCSGIEAATVAWHPLGWKPVAFSEIEPFPSAVLKHHYPSVPNLGDMTKHESWPIDVGSVDLLVGGTPCQSFSVAGLRKGLSDPRGGLMLTYLEIARRLRPRWVVWENVPGVLSSGRGRDFGSFLGALGELGYGWAYRVLDAQWVRTQRHPRAVPQRRRRVFVVGCLGDAAAAASVLFERESVCRDPAPRGASRQGAAVDAESCSGTVSSKWSKGTGGYSGASEHANLLRWPAEICSTLNAKFGEKLGLEDQHALSGAPMFVPVGKWWDGSDCAATLTKQNANGSQLMPDKDNFGAVLQPIVIDRAAFNQGERAQYDPIVRHDDAMPPLVARGAHAVAFRKSKRAQNAAAGHLIPIAIQGNLVGRNAGGPAGVGVSIEGASDTLTKADVHAVAFRKSKRAQSVTDDESWVQAEQANTMNAFDTGERDTHAIVHSLPDAPKPPQDQVCIECGNDLAVAENWHCLECLSDDPKLPTITQTKAIGLDEEQNAVVDGFGTLKARMEGGGFEGSVMTSAMTVRRLTPRECERLQALPDDYTMIPWRGKSAADCPDGPRYKALGNSMAVNCMEWIGERIAAYEEARP